VNFKISCVFCSLLRSSDAAGGPLTKGSRTVRVRYLRIEVRLRCCWMNKWSIIVHVRRGSASLTHQLIANHGSTSIERTIEAARHTRLKTRRSNDGCCGSEGLTTQTHVTEVFFLVSTVTNYGRPMK